MYHRTVIAHHRAKLEEAYRGQLPKGGLREYSVAEVEDWRDRLGSDPRPVSALLKEEKHFVINEWLMCKINFSYAAERYFQINVSGATLGPMYPLWESQRLTLQKMAEIQLDHFETHNPDGILVNCLKARQEGISTLAEALIAHRILFHTNLLALIAADVPHQSGFIFDILERIVEHMPWFLAPTIVNHVKDEEIKFDSGSHAWVGSGKSIRGTEGSRGHLGRGMTVSCVHLSELSTWEDATQIDAALLPAMPLNPETFALFESTAKGRHNWWHEHWLSTKQGHGRFHNVFIPWYAEPSKYFRPAPTAWAPKETTLAHAQQCEEHGPTYMGQKVTLSRDQLYWYETERAYYEARDDFGTFLEEYASNDEECFLFSGRSVFPMVVQQRIRDQRRPLLAVIEVKSNRELVEDLVFRLPDPSSPGRTPAYALDAVRIPPGYGFRVLTEKERHNLDDLEGLLLMWEPPIRGERYVIGADVGDGLGKDRSVAEVLRVGTLERADEQVAQYVSSTIDPSDFAKIIDAVGRFYADQDGYEAMAAVECNGHGLATQAELQRHLGYRHFFIWQIEDTAPGKNPYTNRVGWYSSNRTRPLIVTRYVKAVKTVDPETGFPDLRVNSTFTLDEMQDFHVPPGGTIGDARADEIGSNIVQHRATDDCIIAGAIAVHVAQTIQFEEREPLADARRRLMAERARANDLSEALRTRRDYINTDCTADEAEGREEWDGWEGGYAQDRA